MATYEVNITEPTEIGSYGGSSYFSFPMTAPTGSADPSYTKQYNFRIDPGSTSPGDFTSFSNDVEILTSNSSNTSFDILPIGDGINEGTETFSVFVDYAAYSGNDGTLYSQSSDQYIINIIDSMPEDTNKPPTTSGALVRTEIAGWEGLFQTQFATGSLKSVSSDPDGDSLTFTLLDPPDNGGKVVLSSDGTFQFSAGTDVWGDDDPSTTDTKFTYKVSDGQGGFATGTVELYLKSCHELEQNALSPINADINLLNKELSTLNSNYKANLDIVDYAKEGLDFINWAKAFSIGSGVGDGVLSKVPVYGAIISVISSGVQAWTADRSDQLDATRDAALDQLQALNDTLEAVGTSGAMKALQKFASGSVDLYKVAKVAKSLSDINDVQLELLEAQQNAEYEISRIGIVESDLLELYNQRSVIEAQYDC